MDQRIELPSKQQTLEMMVDKNIKLAFNFLGPIVPDTQFEDKYAICCVVHSWDKSCANSSTKLFFGSFVACAKVYASLYILSALLRGRPLKYWLTKLPHEIFRSTLFLSVNCALYLIFFCLMRKTLGGISYVGSLISSILASFCAILIERKQRRGVLALYLTNLASETVFNMMISRKLFGTIPNGEVAMFAIGSAIYAYLFKTKSLDGSIHSLIKMLVGSSECLNTDHSLHKNRRSRVVKYYGVVTSSLSNFLQLIYNLTLSHSPRHHRSPNALRTFFRWLERHLDAFLNSLSRSTHCKHHLCNHRYNCIIYPIMGFIQRFVVGFLLQALIKCVGSIEILIKNPKFIVKIIKNPANRELGLFLGTFVFIFRIISCLLRWLTNQNQANHGLISGFFAGWSMMFYKSSSIALYVNFKLLEILWMLGVENKKLPLFRSFDIVLYTISTGFILWMALFEPHNIRPAYQRFINKISDQRFSQLNRYFLDIFGVHSSTIDRRN